MAIPAGFEPATDRLEGGCSIQLSYGTSQWARLYTGLILNTNLSGTKFGIAVYSGALGPQNKS